jgi:excisionase family DNA binding protein
MRAFVEKVHQNCPTTEFTTVSATFRVANMANDPEPRKTGDEGADLPAIMTIKEVAPLLALTNRKIRKAALDGQLPAIIIGGEPYILREPFMRLLGLDPDGRSKGGGG